MKKILPVLLFGLIFSCQKKTEPDPVPPQGTNTTTTTTGGAKADTECNVIPPPPAGFPYRDSTKNPYHNTNAFFYNPVAGDEIIVIVEGTIMGANEMMNVNLRTHQTLHLAYLDKYLPSINQQGWIVYSGVDDNIYKIKSNGDSLTKLSSTNGAHDAKWDRKGTSFFYFQDQTSSAQARLMRVDKKGNVVNTIDLGVAYAAPFQKSNNVLVQRTVGPALTIYELDLDNSTEKSVITGTYNTNTGETTFQNLFMDENDTYMYWSNGAGIFRYSFASRVTDTLFRNCESAIYNRPCRSGHLNEITFSKHVIIPTKPYFLIHQFRALEYNLQLKQLRDVTIF